MGDVGSSLKKEGLQGVRWGQLVGGFGRGAGSESGVHDKEMYGLFLARIIEGYLMIVPSVGCSACA